jgi:hypothetical protein
MRERKFNDVEQARLEGRLDDLLGIERHWPPKSGPWSNDDLGAMYREGRHAEIDQARAAGQLTNLLGPAERSDNEER